MNRLAIIGGGNLGVSIVEGLLQSKSVKPEELHVTRRNLSLLEPLRKTGVKISSDNQEAISNCDIAILCVKPWQTREVLEEVRGALNQNILLISCVTGITIDELRTMTDGICHVARAMPNTAIAVRESMTCVSPMNLDEEHRSAIERFFNPLGKLAFINEELMDAATVLGACGIAYCLRFIRAASQGGIEIGFSAEMAQLIAAQTAKGAASLLLEHNSHPEGEIDKVTTPKGCTIAGLNEMEHQGFSSSLIKGIKTSFDKI